MNLLVPFFLAATLATNIKQVETRYDAVESKQLVPTLGEVVQFPTYEHNDDAHAAQKAWLLAKAKELGFTARDAGAITEIDLPGPANAPILGLVVHGDVQPVDTDAWSFPPFSGKADAQYVYGRGSADDKGPLVQALLAMKALKESGVDRTHTVRLLVGSTEESDSAEMGEYLKTHAAPDYSLVLDSNFPVVVGEKAWEALSVTAPSLDDRGPSTLPYTVAALSAGLAPSIVPDHAEVTLRWKEGTAAWEPTMKALGAFALPEGTRLAMAKDGETLRIVVYGHSAHAGVNLEGGRNALVALARLMEKKLPRGGADDLLSFARTAGRDLHGGGLGITDRDPLWGTYAVNVATIKSDAKDAQKKTLTINLRRIPPRSGADDRKKLFAFVDEWNRRNGASLTADGYFDDEPLGFDPNGKLVKRLLRDYAAATGETKPKPAISGGGTYAKRLPNAIAFGMWFPDKPYPGHDVDEKNPIADLQRGTRVLIHALTDIATGERIEQAFK